MREFEEIDTESRGADGGKTMQHKIKGDLAGGRPVDVQHGWTRDQRVIALRAGFRSSV